MVRLEWKVHSEKMGFNLCKVSLQGLLLISPTEEWWNLNQSVSSDRQACQYSYTAGKSGAQWVCCDLREIPTAPQQKNIQVWHCTEWVWWILHMTINLTHKIGKIGTETKSLHISLVLIRDVQYFLHYGIQYFTVCKSYANIVFFLLLLIIGCLFHDYTR